MAGNKLFSNLELVARVDSWPYYNEDPERYKEFMSDYYYFLVEGGFAERTAAMQATIRAEVERGEVPELRKLKNELFAAYSADGQHVLDMDGCAVDKFGTKAFGVHMIGYVDTTEGRRYWVPRRSRAKMSYPGMLDNTVGGSLATREKAIDCIVRETEEEASIFPEYTRKNIVSCGTLSYQMTLDDSGRPGCQHQVQDLYEMKFDEYVILKPNDGEVEEFKLMTLEEVKDALARGEFKLNCAITWMAFLIRHGHVTAENEENLIEICVRMHRKHEFFIV
ncbi:hypothetical protein NA56DRAFT_668695 [Hyaloscypha hepaticicola]|uniref:Nudix hydrolase domain-containing protein n=1 Tax=Hyaloscypha hepaticicola TaxID=2082293 RepID=A0A2J6QES9_9HELO|nr:hypothetical protein NA56DRAFT_668695 [Hyaloscypha hepaticicola]